jgi:RNA polymerase sigma factor (sigma-70 family)
MTPVVTKPAGKNTPVWDDTRLVKECLAGNEEAWSQLIAKYKALIYSVPVKFGLPQQEAAEVFQATCVELLQRLPELRKTRALPKWLALVAHHQCYRWKRQQQRLVSRDSESGLPEPETPAIADNVLQQTQEEHMLREALTGLTPQCRRLMEMLFFETPPRPYVEVAARLGLETGSIGFTRQKCLLRLRRRLNELGFR